MFAWQGTKLWVLNPEPHKPDVVAPAILTGRRKRQEELIQGIYM